MAGSFPGFAIFLFEFISTSGKESSFGLSRKAKCQKLIANSQ